MRIAASLLMANSSKTRICVPVCANEFEEFRQQLQLAAEVADIVELRLDCLAADALHAACEGLAEFVADTDVPLILTFRSHSQGGKRHIADTDHILFLETVALPLSRLAEAGDLFIDVEGHLLGDPRAIIVCEQIGWERIICSHHEFSGDPIDLDAVFDRLSLTPARIIKIAVRTLDAADVVPIFNLLERSAKENRELIPIGMGEAGVSTRILGPAYGAFLSFAALRQDRETAPGQLTADALESVYRIRDLNEETQVAGLIGSPVVHSVSPDVHNGAFEDRRLNAVYIPFEVRDLDRFFKEIVRVETRKVRWPLLGFSVTAPHKLSVIEQLDELDDDARRIGAVNTVVLRSGRLYGYNTDVLGFIEPLRKRAQRLLGLRAAVLGGGGGARSAIWGMLNEGVDVTVFARDPNRARSIGNDLGVEVRPLVGARFGDFDLVVNTTPLGTRGTFENETPANAGMLRGARLAYDLVYNPLETVFMREASEAGCQVIGGLEMLVAQAEEQFRLWTGLDAPGDVMSAAARRALRVRDL